MELGLLAWDTNPVLVLLNAWVHPLIRMRAEIGQETAGAYQGACSVGHLGSCYRTVPLLYLLFGPLFPVELVHVGMPCAGWSRS